MFGFFSKKKKTAVAPKQAVTEIEKITAKEILSALNQMQKELDRLKLAVVGASSDAGAVGDVDRIERSLGQIRARQGAVQKSGTEKMIEGVFDGQGMVGADGEQYDVPANYASKSKLVEGDILKLTITDDGSFIFKQISPVERARLVGHLIKDKDTNTFVVLAGDKIYRVLMASVTYFKGEEGDEVVILVPKDAQSDWAAVENTIKKGQPREDYGGGIE